MNMKIKMLRTKMLRTKMKQLLLRYKYYVYAFIVSYLFQIFVVGVNTKKYGLLAYQPFTILIAILTPFFGRIFTLGIKLGTGEADYFQCIFKSWRIGLTLAIVLAIICDIYINGFQLPDNLFFNFGR